MASVSNQNIISGEKAHISVSLQPKYQRILQVALAVILLTGILLGATGYLPPVASAAASVIALISLIAVSCVCKSNPSQKLSFPVVEKNLKAGFFVDVLNYGGYIIDGKRVVFSPAGNPEKFSRLTNFAENLHDLREKYSVVDQKEIEFQFKDLTTEQAIEESNATRIALNFANEHHAGGGPGFHLDKERNLLVYDTPSAKAQEESLCQRSDLMASLAKLPHTLRADERNSNFVRSYYDTQFDSKEMAYISSNHLFAVQGGSDFYASRYLEEPKAVSFVTSAGTYYGDRVDLDCSKDSTVYNDAKARIETHLLAAAWSAARSKTEHPDQPIELILGAFGCGAFAPSGNPDDYRRMIASIYQELLPNFGGFFDTITFAVPSFGSKDPRNPAVANFNIFKEAFGSTE